MFVFNYGRLRTLRRKKDLTQAALGHMLGCTGAVIGRWENGEVPISAEDLARISYFLDESDFQAYFWRSDRNGQF